MRPSAVIAALVALAAWSGLPGAVEGVVGSCSAPCDGASSTLCPNLLGPLAVPGDGGWESAASCKASCVARGAPYWFYIPGPGCACFTGCDPTDLIDYSVLGQGVRGDCSLPAISPVNTTCTFKKNETVRASTPYTLTTWGCNSCNLDIVTFVNPQLMCPGDLSPRSIYTADRSHCTVAATIKPGGCFYFEVKRNSTLGKPQFSMADFLFDSTLRIIEDDPALEIRCQPAAVAFKASAKTYDYTCRLFNYKYRTPDLKFSCARLVTPTKFIATLRGDCSIRGPINLGDGYTVGFTVGPGDSVFELPGTTEIART